MKFFLAAIVVLALAAVAMSSDAHLYDLSRPHQELFKSFVNDYNVTFKTAAEKAQRFKIFSTNVRKINQLNADAKAKGHNTRFALNKFGLMSEEEFRATVLLFLAIIFILVGP